VPPVASLRAQAVYPTYDALIEVSIDTHGVEDLGAVLQQSRKDFVDVADWKRIIRLIVAGRACWTCAPSIPDLARRITIAYEHHVLGLLAARYEYGNRLRLPEPRYVVKITVLPVRVLDIVIAVPDRCGGQNGNRVAAHEARQLAAPACKLVPRDGLDRFQCSGTSGGPGWSRRGPSSSNTSCTPIRTNSTSSA